jgi:HSP20 family molecular chaperone IbpA
VSEEKATLSANWRKNKKRPRKFNIFRALNRSKDNNTPKVFRIEELRIKRHVHPYLYQIPKNLKERNWRQLEPLTDVFEEKDEVVIVTEFAGFQREALRTNIKNQRLILSADALDRKYHKSLNLPKRVIPNTLHTTYKNGVLEIRLKKVARQKAIHKLAG